MYLRVSFSGYSSSSWGEWHSIRQEWTSTCFQDHMVAGQTAVVHQEAPCAQLPEAFIAYILQPGTCAQNFTKSANYSTAWDQVFKQTSLVHRQDIQTIIDSAIKFIILIMASFFCHILTSSWMDLHFSFLQKRTCMLIYGEKKC